MHTTDPTHRSPRRLAAALLLAFAIALAALAIAGADRAAADPVCEDTPYGQVCEDLETEDCNPPDCQDPGVHAWPDPIGQTQSCIEGQTSPYTGCDEGIVTIRAPGATSVTTIPTPDQAPGWDEAMRSIRAVCFKFTGNENCIQPLAR